jgi:hypothetical protein
MAQVIEVRLVDPQNNEVLADRFTAPSGKYDQFDHTALHREAIELALHAWSGGVGVLKSIEREMDTSGRSAGSGANFCWYYGYWCAVPDEDSVDRAFFAHLFTQYREKER